MTVGVAGFNLRLKARTKVRYSGKAGIFLTILNDEKG